MQSGGDWAAHYNTGTGTKSADGYSTVKTTASEATCLKASLAEYGAKVTTRRKFLSKGSWGHVPPGCTVQSGGDWAAHYNTGTGTGRPKSGYSLVKEMTESVSGCPAETSKAACEGGSTQGFNAKCCKWATRGTPQSLCLDVAKKKYGALFKAGGLVTGSWSHVPGGCSIRHAGRVIQQTEATCLKAAVAEYGAKVTARRSSLVSGSWGHVPPDVLCSRVATGRRTTTPGLDAAAGILR